MNVDPRRAILTGVLFLAPLTLAGALAAGLSIQSQSITAPAASSVAVPRNTTALSSVANEASAAPGATISSTATLSGGTSGAQPSGGTITFTLVGPSASAPGTCPGSSPVAGTKTVNAGNGAYTLSVSAPATAGNYWWYATYGGDANNTTSHGACGDAGDEVSVVSTASATASLAPSSGVIGTVVTLSGSSFPPNSTITATYGGSGVTLSGTATTNGSGAIPTASAPTFVVPAGTAGAHPVVVTAGGSSAPSVNFTVVPAITLSSTSGVAGATVTVSGTGFGATKTLTATFGVSALSLGGTTTTGANGSFAGATFSVPNSAPAPYTVTFTDASANAASAIYTIASPAIALGSSTGNTGASIAISGTGFPATSAVTATFNGAALTLTPAQTTSASGAFSGATFSVPTLPAGTYSVAATAGTRTASANFTITPSIALTPSSGVAGSSVSIAGSGFGATKTITATFGGSAVTLGGTTTTTATGTFSAATFTVPNNVAGSYSVVVTDAVANSASASFSIPAPAIVLTPSTGTVGASVSISGSNFPASTALTATFAGSAVTLAGTTTTTATGTFSAATFTVPSSSDGAQTVVVTAATRTASATFTVSPKITALVLANRPTGGTAGQLDQSDTVTVTFNESLAVSSICSAWTNNAANQTNSTATVHVTGNGHTGNNVLSISAWSACTSSFRFGSIDLGSTAYVTSSGTSDKPIDFTGSTVAYDATAHTIKITLGAPQTGGGVGTAGPVANSIATLTMDTGVTWATGIAVSPATFATANIKQF